MCVAHCRRGCGDDAGGRTRHGAIEPAQGAQQSDRSDHRLSDYCRKEVRARTSVTVTKRSLSRSRQGEQGARPDLVLVPGRLAARPVLRSDRELPAFQQPQPVSQLPRPSGLLPVGRASSSSVVMLPTKEHPVAAAPEAGAKGTSKPGGCWIARSTRAMTPRETNCEERVTTERGSRVGVPRIAAPDGAGLTGRACRRYAASRSIEASTASPISAVLTMFAPSVLMSLVRSPLPSVAAIACSIRSASLPMAKE